MLARSNARLHGRAQAHDRQRKNTMLEYTQAKQQRAKLHTSAGTHAGHARGVGEHAHTFFGSQSLLSAETTATTTATSTQRVRTRASCTTLDTHAGRSSM